jgi:hypothetical protein
MQMVQECRNDNLLATTVIQERVTDLLNLPSIIERFDSQFVCERDTEQQLAV